MLESKSCMKWAYQKKKKKTFLLFSARENSTETRNTVNFKNISYLKTISLNLSLKFESVHIFDSVVTQ